MFAIIDE
jgi:hypothetical protein